MPIETRDHAHLITHALAKDTLSTLRSVETEQVDFRKGLIQLGRLCGYEIIDGAMDTEFVPIETPLAETTGERVKGLDDVVIINVLRAATPFVEGLLKAFPSAKQGVISASRDESAGMDDDGEFPITVDYVKLPEITSDDTVIVADPMLATGSTICAVLDYVLEATDSYENLFVLSAVSAPPGLVRVDETFPEVDILTVAIDDRLNDDGFIIPGLGDAGDRTFGTT
ncbi:uracil phosphoribosyltransferase [Halohasta litchfieldiae]|jgi:uracil phosphoribosyltransferase|uniref:Uracil phosphoribosyltransferase n=1 Tax=Halohasta litchfieldiae TaxID=1073996 RepID=A0A1H6QZ04_9EURY|nr:uracil phosphoribosyltransferase [Halohasta litchfieldiae]ATW88547.1 uracil phosphoribosyltransferase [Halohasta litchfieldiae]SEI48839.1 uracil phosphoribosyltransferase [Halohasta litchfieldiae]